MLPTGDHDPGDAFRAWRDYSQTAEDFAVGRIVSGGCVRGLDPAAIAAYDAPFPDDTYKAGARIWPSFFCTSPDDPEAPANREAWKVLERFDKPFLCCFSDRDPITGGGDKPFRERVPGAQGQAHTTIEGGGHFLQEDKGPELAAVLNDFIAATSTQR
jgi:haloalkane dehalogenase